MDQREFEGRKILVLGASSGIGRACAIQLGARGAQVILVGRNRERLEETAGHIPEGRSAILPCDVSDFGAAQAVVKDAVKLDGAKLNGCVFSVGISMPIPISVIREQQVLEVFRTNLFSLFGVLKAFSSRRVSEDGASFVAISSEAALGALKAQSVYGASKAGINACVASTANELAPRRIRVNAVCPGMVDTPMGKGLHFESPEQLQKLYPLGVLVPEDVAGAVLFLLSDASKKITAQAIDINGGSFEDGGHFAY